MPGERGLVLRCRPDGTLVEVQRDDFELGDRAGTDRKLSLLVDRSSFQKALSFTAEISLNGAVYDREMVVSSAAGPLTLWFAGIALGDGIRVVASCTRAGLRQLIEQDSAWRADPASSSETLAARSHVERDDRMFEELTRLNNELSEMHRDLARANAELERLHALKNQLLGMAAHDLRAPLAAVSTYAEFLTDEAGPSLSAEHLRFVEIIRRSTDNMLRLVEDLLDVSAIEAGKLSIDRQPMNVRELLIRVIEIYRPLARRKAISLDLELDGEIPDVLADARRIEQVVGNLVGNAIKFSREQSAITIGARLAPEGVVTWVRDAGPGIPLQEQGRIFGPYQTAASGQASRGSRTGLGLAIATSILRAHCGRLWVESTPGVGATFFALLPLA